MSNDDERDSDEEAHNRDLLRNPDPDPVERDYVVRWEIDVTATSPRLAAIEALNSMMREGSIAHVFDVFSNNGEPTVATASHDRIDLDAEPLTEAERAHVDGRLLPFGLGVVE